MSNPAELEANWPTPALREPTFVNWMGNARPSVIAQFSLFVTPTVGHFEINTAIHHHELSVQVAVYNGHFQVDTHHDAVSVGESILAALHRAVEWFEAEEERRHHEEEEAHLLHELLEEYHEHEHEHDHPPHEPEDDHDDHGHDDNGHDDNGHDDTAREVDEENRRSHDAKS